jgi:hypothetical protein
MGWREVDSVFHSGFRFQVSGFRPARRSVGVVGLKGFKLQVAGGRFQVAGSPDEAFGVVGFQVSSYRWQVAGCRFGFQASSFRPARRSFGVVGLQARPTKLWRSRVAGHFILWKYKAGINNIINVGFTINRCNWESNGEDISLSPSIESFKNK